MLLRRLKLTHTRCFFPAIFFNHNPHDEEGTEVIDQKKVGGWQGVVNAFSPDKDGNPSPDVRAITSTICYSALLGGLYGSLSYSKQAYNDFFHKNQSTLFQNQFEAKAKLQTQVSLGMCKGIFKWGPRVALFCGPYITIVTIVNAYKQDISVISYGIAGFFVGGLARIFLGFKGFIAGSALGGVLGVMVGCLTLLILKFSPLTMDELKEWQSQSQSNRDAFFIKEQRGSAAFQYDQPPVLLDHDTRIDKFASDSNNTS